MLLHDRRRRRFFNSGHLNNFNIPRYPTPRGAVFHHAMNRRDSIKKLALGSGVLLALPSWAQSWSTNDFSSGAGIFSADHEALLSAVADTIIPAGNSIGAVTVGVDKFLVKLISDCYDQPTQENVQRGLTALESSAKEKFSRSFAACDQPQREKLLLAFRSSGTKEDQEFFNVLKTETVRGFNTSKEVMTKYLNYKIAPGHYYGCVDV